MKNTDLSKTKLSYWRPAFLLALLPSAVFTLSSCGGNKLGEGLAISVSPTKAYIVPGNGTSCTDAATNIGNTVGTPISTSVMGPRLFFTNFRLQWQKPDALSVDVIEVFVNGGPITNYMMALDSTEIEALIGKTSGLIPYDATRGTAANLAFNVDSDNSKEKDSVYPGCGLSIGGLPVPATNTNNPTATNIYTVNVTIILLGTATDASGNLSPVKQTIYATAQSLF